MPDLSLRLKTVASLVPVGSRVADVGTDHAYLPAYLISSGISSSVIACDKNTKPLRNAAKTVELVGCGDKISLRLSDGLEKVLPCEADAVIMAGMGGEVIAGIIERAQWLKDGKLLILQPMTSPEYLRRYLYSSGYVITDETAVEDLGKVYTVMRVTSGNEEVSDDVFYVTGKINAKTDMGKTYLKKQYIRYSTVMRDLESLNCDNEKFLYSQKVCAFIKHKLEET